MNWRQSESISTIKELLGKEKTELVAIAITMESSKHAAIALDDISAGCNVIVEKSIGLSIADTEKKICTSEESWKRRKTRTLK